MAEEAVQSEEKEKVRKMSNEKILDLNGDKSIVIIHIQDGAE